MLHSVFVIIFVLQTLSLILNTCMSLVDLGGACQVHATPYGTQFFHFSIHFHQKAPTSEGHAPQWVHAPPMGNPGSATACNRTHNLYL